MGHTYTSKVCVVPLKFIFQFTFTFNLHLFAKSAIRLVWLTRESGQLVLVFWAPGMWSPVSRPLTPVLGSLALALTYLPGRQLLLGATWCLRPLGALEVGSAGGVVQSAGRD